MKRLNILLIKLIATKLIATLSSDSKLLVSIVANATGFVGFGSCGNADHNHGAFFPKIYTSHASEAHEHAHLQRKLRKPKPSKALNQVLL